MTDHIFKYICTLSVAAFLLITGCTHKPDQRLIDADSLIESHPDSALVLIDRISLLPNTSEYDRAFYGLLVTHARYKNFIEEDNDSLIRSSAAYFLDHNFDEEAARAFFLAGMIQMMSNHYGEAAVSLTLGLETARKGRSHIWQGQCARGLFMLYGNLYDSSAQMIYAEEEYDAFTKGNIKDWINWGRLDMAVAYNNNGQYERAIQIADALASDPPVKKDSLLLSEVLSLSGSARNAMGKHRESIGNYVAAFKVNPMALSSSDISNLTVSASKIEPGLLSREEISIIDSIQNKNDHRHSFETYALQGDFENAYHDLMNYKDEQEKVLKTILHNNVSQSVIELKKTQEIILKSKHRSERLTWIIIVIVVFVILCTVIQYQRRISKKKEDQWNNTIENLETLQKDFANLLDKNNKMLGMFTDAIRKKYDRINKICDEYYQQQSSEKHTELKNEIDAIMKDFNDLSVFSEVEQDVDQYTDGLYKSFKSDFPELNEDLYRMYLYLLLDFSPRSIAILLKVETSVIYNRKSRLKAKILNSDTLRKDEYLNAF